MKTTILKYITVTFAAGAMLLAGCNDLDQEPTNKFTDKAFLDFARTCEHGAQHGL
ncbi:MAG: hypothetical protein ACLRSE_01795 [Alistipes finegoldii]